MNSHHTFENGLKYRPDYAWPKEGTKRKCPVCNDSLELVDNAENYYGKPWWCVPCQWQYSEEDLRARSRKPAK